MAPWLFDWDGGKVTKVRLGGKEWLLRGDEHDSALQGVV
jgi:hypothetical protein